MTVDLLAKAKKIILDPKSCSCGSLFVVVFYQIFWRLSPLAGPCVKRPNDQKFSKNGPQNLELSSRTNLKILLRHVIVSKDTSLYGQYVDNCWNDLNFLKIHMQTDMYADFDIYSQFELVSRSTGCEFDKLLSNRNLAQNDDHIW